MFTFNTATNGATTSIIATLNGVAVAALNVPTAIFTLVQGLQGQVANKDLQQQIATAMGWSLNKAGRCPQAAAMLEKITKGYVANSFKGNLHQGQAVIALLQGYSTNGRTFFGQANGYQASPKPMLTRQNKAVQTSDEAQPAVQELDSVA